MKDLSTFKTQKELFDYLVANKSALINEKKTLKDASDPCVGVPFFSTGIAGESADKAAGSIPLIDRESFEAKLVINTTNIRDSHGDVHFPGLWNQSLRQNKTFYHLKEHQKSFEAVIDNAATAYVAMMDWKTLGQPYEGKTQALIFNSNITKSRNPEMHKQYANGWVPNHSVGMRYIKLELAINHKDYQKEKALWDELIDQVANKEETEQAGYFWAVKEAQILEGSAVLFGSNRATPTLSAKSTFDEPDTAPLRDKSESPILYLSNLLKK